MKAEPIKERPEYVLLKQSDIVNYYHLQLPRWLLEDSRYLYLSLEAKFTYTLLFNRFQLSKLNGWINDNGEVFVIYTRKELSACLNISEKRVSAAMHELNAMALIWERRCGRGFANQIYLANVRISDYDAQDPKGAPLDPTPSNKELRTDEIESLEDETAISNHVLSDKVVDNYVDNHSEIVDNSTQLGVSVQTETQNTIKDLSSKNFMNSQYSGFKTVVSSVQEHPKLPSNNKEKDLKSVYENQCQPKSSQWGYDCEPKKQMADTDILNRLMELAEVHFLSDKDKVVMKDAIERLYFMEKIKIGNAVYPNERIRSHLWRLNSVVVQDAIFKITKNTNKIRDSSAYVVTILFNTIMETNSDLIVDPYLNFLRNTYKKDTSKTGGD